MTDEQARELVTEGTAMENETRLLSLKAENVMRLKVVELEFDPDGELKIIGGDNGQGKTSVLKALAMAIGGGKAQVDKPIHDGKKEARVIVDLDAFVVTRNWTKKGSYLKVVCKDGASYPSPQALLDGLFGSLGFDPLAFTEMGDREQSQTLSALVGLDFSEVDADRKALCEKRRLIGQDVKSLAGQLDGLPKVEAPDEEVTVTELLAELDKIGAANRERRQAFLSRDSLIGGAERAEEAVERKLVAIAELQARIDEHNRQVEVLQATADQKRAEAIRIDIPDDIPTAPVQEQIANAEETNAAVRQNQARANVAKRHADAKKDYDAHSKTISDLDAKKEADLAAASFPVDGLGFNDDGQVTFNDIPFSQAGNAEKLRVSTAMGLAMNKDLKLLLIDDGERLDKNGKKILAEMAAEAGATILMSCVTDDPSGCSVIIEDGVIKDA